MRISLILALPLLLGCATIRQEIDYPGGIPEYQANRLLPAYSRVDRADRYLIALAILSQLAAETASNELQAYVASDEIRRTHSLVVELRRAASEDDCPSATTVSGQCNVDVRERFSFETTSYEVQASLYSLSKAIAMNAELEVSLRKLAELDVIWLMRQVGNLRRNVPLVRRTAAVYRDITVIVASALQETCRTRPPAILARAQADCDSLDIVAASRRYSFAEDLPDRGPMSDARAAIRRLMTNPEFDMSLGDVHRLALRDHIVTSCDRLERIQRLDDPNATVRRCLPHTQPS